jgi:hypothetical protein
MSVQQFDVSEATTIILNVVIIIINAGLHLVREPEFRQTVSTYSQTIDIPIFQQQSHPCQSKE